jgi:hypothetical protein
MDNQPTPPAAPIIGTADLQYLDTIEAPVTPVKQSPFKNPRFVKLIIAAVVVIVGTIVAAIVINSQADRTPIVAETLELRFANLTTLRNTYGNDVSFSPQLKKISTNLNVSLTQATRGLDPFLPDLKIDPKKPSATVQGTEQGISDAINQQLAEAKINGRLAINFAQQFSAQITQITALLDEFDTRMRRADVRDYVLSTKTNLQSIQIELEAYIKTNS